MRTHQLVAIAMASILVCGTAQAFQRVALVIGNSNYAYTPKLPNPQNDAADIASSLSRLGFAVTETQDLSFNEMRRALGTFSQKALGAEMAVVFYAGHGMEVNNQNYLIPTDAELKTDLSIPYETIPLDMVTEAVSGAKGLKLVILDACRNNPFVASMTRTTSTRSIGRGLARVEPSSGTLVAFAAKEGTVASDGIGRNSPFSNALLSYLEEPGLEINFLFRKVRDKVMEQTDNRQEPFTYGSLPGQAIFLREPEPSRSDEPPAIRGPTLIEAVAAAVDVNTPRGWMLLAEHFGKDSLTRPEALEAAAEMGTKRHGYQPGELFEAALAFDADARRKVQAGLNAIGIDIGTVDGQFGPGTRRGIKTAQARTGSPVTGYLDAAVLAEIGVEWSVPPETDFVDAPFATSHAAEKLAILGEEPSVLKYINCLGLRSSIYGRRGRSLYFAVPGDWTTQGYNDLARRCGGYLATISSKDENSFLYSMFGADSSFFTIGFDVRTKVSYKQGPVFGLYQDPVDREPDGGWRWDDGEPMVFKNWVPHAPSEHDPGQDRGTFFAEANGRVDLTDSPALGWKDLNPAYAKSAVIEIDLP